MITFEAWPTVAIGVGIGILVAIGVVLAMRYIPWLPMIYYEDGAFIAAWG